MDEEIEKILEFCKDENNKDFLEYFSLLINEEYGLYELSSGHTVYIPELFESSDKIGMGLKILAKSLKRGVINNDIK